MQGTESYFFRDNEDQKDYVKLFVMRGNFFHGPHAPNDIILLPFTKYFALTSLVGRPLPIINSQKDPGLSQ